MLKNREKTRGTGLLADRGCVDHDPGAMHPEQPARFETVVKRLKADGLYSELTPVDSRPATHKELVRCHPAEYLSLVEEDVRQGASMLRTGDTNLCPASLEVATRSAGGVLNAVDLVLQGDLDNAFCLVRPPGHHACPGTGMGFCIFNNVALAVRHAQVVHGVRRALIVDWDVHHGNGTQEFFYTDPNVLFFSTHQYPWYPGTGAASDRGAGAGEGLTINCPFPAGSGCAEILGAFDRRLLGAADEFRPEIVIVSAGFDSCRGDPLGHFQLVDKDFSDLTLLCLDIARRHAKGRLISVLEGGYNLDGLACAATAHIAALMEVSKEGRTG